MPKGRPWVARRRRREVDVSERLSPKMVAVICSMQVAVRLASWEEKVE